MPKITSRNRVTIPVAVLREAGLQPGGHVVVEAVGDGEVRVRPSPLTFDNAFGALTGAYPPTYLHNLDREDDER